MTNIDLALRSRLGQLMVAVEIKNLWDTSSEWAAELRRNILAHGNFPHTQYFLLVTPDRLYLWKDGGVEPVAIAPSYESDAQPVFGGYIERSGLDPSDISRPAFELVVSSWLADLIRSDETPESSWMATSGFLDAIRAGRIEYDLAA
jgi:hypothetical protein